MIHHIAAPRCYRHQFGAVIVFIIVTLFLATASPAQTIGAATDGGKPESVPATEAEISAIVATLSDETARAALVRQLQLLQQASGEEEKATIESGIDSTQLWSRIRQRLESWWDSLWNIDPLQLLKRAVITVIVLLAVWLAHYLAMTSARRIIARLFNDDESDADAAAPDDQSAADSTPPHVPRIVRHMINAAVVIAGLLALLIVWGGDVGDALARFADTGWGGSLVDIVLIVTLLVALWNIVDLLIVRSLRAHARSVHGPRRGNRLETLAPLMSKVLHIAILTLGALLLLSEFGVDIAPLLAGAGILGLAFGFGAQSLVKDFLTGITVLLEDSASVGDIVEIGDHAGKVESMGIRVMTLRDLAGTVHTIPYSEVSIVQNMTKLFSYALLDVGVAYRENTDDVCAELTDVGEALQQDESFGSAILEPLEILGVDALGDSAVVIKIRLKTQPGEQWRIARELNRRIKLRFDEADIEIPFPHTTIYFGESREGTAPPMPLKIIDGDASTESLASHAAS